MSKLTEEIIRQNKESWDRIQAAKKKPPRLILSTSFTIDQIRAFLRVARAINNNEDPGMYFEAEEMGAVVMKFRTMAKKWARATKQRFKL